MPTTSLWPLILGLLTLIVGAAMFIAGFWPRRRGQTPYCRGCGYSLVGLESARCPECGSELTPQAIVRGDRIRRPWVFRPGLALAIVGVFLLSMHFTGALAKVEWIRYRPAAWLVRDLADAKLQSAAIAELDRRRDAGQLSEAIEDRLMELALREQASASTTLLTQRLIDFAAARIEAGKATEAQKERFFEQAMGYRLEVRPTVILGDRAPFRVSRRGRGPSGDWWMRLEYRNATVNGVEAGRFYGSTAGSGFGGGSIGLGVPTTQPGVHTLDVTIAAQIHKGRGASGVPLWVREKTLTATFQVLPEAPPDHVRMLDQPELRPQIEAATRVTQLERRANGDYAIVIDVNNAPANIAFEAFAHVRGQEYPLGTITVVKGTQMGTHIAADRLKGIEADHIDIILRSSEKVARSTVDLYEIWKGEVVLKDLAVKRE